MKAVVGPSLTRVARVLAVIYGLLLIVLAVIPSIDAPGVGISDWVLHAVAYGGFSGLLLLAGLGTFNAVIGGIGLGLATEILQSMIPYRRFQLLDLLADSVGAVIVVMIGFVLLRFVIDGRQVRQ